MSPASPLDPLHFARRKTIRLEEHDYSSGTYFVTLCVRRRRTLLGVVKGGVVLRTSVGTIVSQEWVRTAEMRPDVSLDAFVMPDHFHGILTLHPSLTDMGCAGSSRAHAVRPYDLGRVVAGFKSLMHPAVPGHDPRRLGDAVATGLLRARRSRGGRSRSDTRLHNRQPPQLEHSPGPTWVTGQPTEFRIG